MLADPDDVGLRVVWADALMERDDPLGELIAIQILARGAALTPTQEKRVRSLIAKHRVAWLGPLADIVQHREGLVFDRGVLAECQIQIKRVPALARAIGDPRWGALRRLWFCDLHAYDPRIVELLVHPVMRSLREVFTVGMNNVFPALARHERPLPFTTVWTVDDSFRKNRAGDIRTVHAAPGLPALERLGFNYQVEDYLLELPIVRTISTLGLVNALPAGTWLAATRGFENVRCLELRKWWIPVQGPQRSHFILSFTRGRDGDWRELAIDRSGAPTLEMLVEGLASVPADQLVRITAPADVVPALRRFTRAEVVPATRNATGGAVS